MQRSVTRISGLFGLAIGMVVVGIATISMTGCSANNPATADTTPGNHSMANVQPISSLPPAQMNQKIQSDAQNFAAYRQAHPLNAPQTSAQ
jgi:hypothetical protein